MGANRAFNFLNDLTPVGSAVSAEQAGKDWRQGDYLAALGNGAMAALGAVPDFGAVTGKVGHAIIAPLFHGSPHKFEKFALDKIGTGNGSRAFGEGVYLAQQRDVADFYARPRGHIYEAQVDAVPEDFIDWTEPFDVQPKAALDLARATEADRMAAEGPSAYRLDQVGGYTRDGALIKPGTGAALYAYLAAPRYGSDSAAAAELLRQSGVAGTRVKDWWSRPGNWAGTHNYVVFDPSIIDILNRR
jgi:hypothetical protein